MDTLVLFFSRRRMSCSGFCHWVFVAEKLAGWHDTAADSSHGT